MSTDRHKPRGWTGVDLDGTLAKHASGESVDSIGEPIAPMVERVKKLLAEGREVRIVTARVSVRGTESAKQYSMIAEWCVEHLGQALKVQAHKDYAMLQLYDDRAIGVVTNQGVLATDAQYAIGHFVGSAEMREQIVNYDTNLGNEGDAYANIEPNPDHETANIAVYFPGYERDVPRLTPREARCLAASILKTADAAEQA